VTGDVGAAQSEDGGANEAGKTNPDSGEQRLGQTAIIDDPPSPFVVEWVARVSGRNAIDLAMGRGRHALVLARRGLLTFGVDRQFAAVSDCVRRARAENLVVRGWCADLEQIALPRDAFDVVVVTRYLQRDLFPSIRSMTTRGGVVIYETFTVNQRSLGCGPTSPEHLLEPGELARRFDGFEVLFSEEVTAREAVARIVARRV
jgi:2-polyprenyl-3-methyl-5-hydroxy-6-metoxy-1,4-benzoquinol methylase